MNVFDLVFECLCSVFECLLVILRPTWLPKCISRLAIRRCRTFLRLLLPLLQQTIIFGSFSTSFILAGDFNPTGNGFCSIAITRHSKLKQIIKNGRARLVVLHATRVVDVARANKGIKHSQRQISTVVLDFKVHVPKNNFTRKVKVR